MANEIKAIETGEVKPQVLAPVPAKPKDSKPPQKGDTVRVVTAHGEAVPATVKSVNGEKADVEFVFRDQPFTITGAPHDPTGTQPDSWHRI